jgi:hypothetical protein
MSLLHVTANHPQIPRRNPGKVTAVEVEERHRVTSGQKCRPFLLCIAARSPTTDLVSRGPKSAIFTASGIATVLLYVVRVNR